jgi:hypothetical protein
MDSQGNIESISTTSTQTNTLLEVCRKIIADSKQNFDIEKHLDQQRKELTLVHQEVDLGIIEQYLEYVRNNYESDEVVDFVTYIITRKYKK